MWAMSTNGKRGWKFMLFGHKWSSWWLFWRLLLALLALLLALQQNQPLEVFCEKGVLKNVAKFTENTWVWVSILIKLQPSGLFSCEFRNTSKDTFFTERQFLLLQYQICYYQIYYKEFFIFREQMCYTLRRLQDSLSHQKRFKDRFNSIERSTRR